MKQALVHSSLIAALAFAAVPAGAQYGADTGSYSAEARVVNVVPIRESATVPRQECWTEYEPGGNRAAGAVIGGIAGGLIGHQFGSGSGNTAATIAGTIGGAAVGSEAARRYGDGRVERCRTVSDYSERVIGYDVTYRYQGREYVTRMPYDPGPTMPINVTVAPTR